MMDQDGNTLKDFDWAAFAVNGMLRGQITYVSEGGISLPDGTVSPAFVNLVVQIPAQNNRLPNVSKIYGPNKQESDNG